VTGRATKPFLGEGGREVRTAEAQAGTTRQARCYPVAVVQLVQVDRAAEKAGVSRRTIYRWLKDGSLKRFKRGGDPFVLVDLGAVRQLRKPRPVAPKRSA